MVKVILAIALLAMAGCATTQPVENPRSIWCEHNEPRRYSVDVVDAMSERELDEVNAHNMKGEEWCGWTV